MKLTEHFKCLPGKVKKQMRSALLLLCAIATFAVPAFGGGYTALKEPEVTSSAAAIEDVDLLLVAASAFGEARKVMNATDNDAKETFVNNTAQLVTSSKWHNVGLIVGARDALSGSIWSAYQAPITLSASEMVTYNNSELAEAYNKYKAFGFAMQNLNSSAQKSSSTAVSVEEGLDAMSVAAIKLGSFGVEFLNDYNPGPVLLALYNSRYLTTYSANKLVQIVNSNEVLRNIVHLFGDTVPGTRFSFFVILNAVLAVFGLALSMLITLFGNRTIGDNIKKFLVRIVIGTVGIYVIANLMSTLLDWTTATILDVGGSAESRYVEENLNMYDWYLTGFAIPGGTTLPIDANGRFMFTPEIVRAINEYTYGRLYGGASDEAMKARMESYTMTGNVGTASFITPAMVAGDDGAEGWSTDKYYAIMKNYAENKEDLLDDGGDETSPLHGQSGSPIYKCKYLWMSSLRLSQNGDGWEVSGSSSSSYYGLNPISAFNLIRSDFSGDSISATATVYPSIAYVAFDVTRGYSEGASTNMNAITRFIACFTLVLAALKGLITIFTAGFAGLLSGGIKTAMGSSHGLGQAIGAVIALLLGIIGISVIMSMTMSLLDTVYGIAKDLVGDSAVIDSFLQPVQDAVGGIPVLGSLLMSACRGIAEMIMTLVLALTFPKLGGIPITVFAQYMSEIPGNIAEKAQMIENQIYGSRMGGGGLGGGHRPSSAGRTARAMAGQAFSSSAKQAAAITASGAAAVGSLAGASLSTLGKAANKKADGIEGKPENPGIDDKKWEEMSEEQQGKAAEVAANTEGWDEMDNDQRQQALEDAGVFGNGEAESGAGNATGEDAVGNQEEVTPEEAAAAATVAEAMDDEGAPQVATPGEEASMNNQGEQAEGEPGQTAAAAQAEATAQGTASTSAPKTEPGVAGVAGAVAGTGSGTGSGTGDKKVENVNNSSGGTTNLKEGDNITAKNHIEAKNKVDQNADVKQVDAGQHVDASQINELGGKTSDQAPTMGGGAQGVSGAQQSTGTAGTATVAAAGSAGGVSQGLPSGRAGSQGTGTSSQTGASAHYSSVSRNVSQGGNTSEIVNATAQANMAVNNSDLSRSSSNSTSTSSSSSSTTTHAPGAQSLDPQASAESRKAANGGGGTQSMNKGQQTAKSKYGKEMTVKEQKQARALHAIGDGLQMMGGNRTMGQGVREALGHAKDAAVTYATPIEIQESGFMTNLRMRRMERDRKNDRRNDKKK